MDAIFKKQLVKYFEKRMKPTNFISNLYKKVKLTGVSAEIQGQDVKSTYSVDVKLGTGARRHEFGIHETKTVVVPEYNDITTVSEEDILRVQAGETEYSTKVANSVQLVAKRQILFSDMQRRAEEKQAVEALLNGKITLADKTEIEFRKKATHNINLSAKKWTDDTSNPIEELSKAIELITTDGKVGTSEFNLILENKGLRALLGNKNFKENSNFNNNVKRNDIKMPVEMTAGATFHGQFSVDSYIVNLWTYNAIYDIPTGFNFANEGYSCKYIPDGKAILLPTETEFEVYYGAIADVNTQDTSFIGGGLNLVETEQLSYAYPVIRNGVKALECGVKSRPLYYPVNIDCVVTFENVA